MRKLVALAMDIDRLIQGIADQFNGNAARRQALRRLAFEVANEVRQQRWGRNHAKANQRLGRTPQGYRMMLNMRADHYHHSV